MTKLTGDNFHNLEIPFKLINHASTQKDFFIPLENKFQWETLLIIGVKMKKVHTLHIFYKVKQKE